MEPAHTSEFLRSVSAALAGASMPSGLRSSAFRAMAAALNGPGIKSSRGGEWHPSLVASIGGHDGAGPLCQLMLLVDADLICCSGSGRMLAAKCPSLIGCRSDCIPDPRRSERRIDMQDAEWP